MSNQSKILKTFSVKSSSGELDFDIYSDGDLVVTTPTYQSYVIPASEVDTIKKKLGVENCTPKCEVAQKFIDDANIQAIKRLGPNVKQVDNGWSAVVGLDGVELEKEIRYIYTSRAKARECSISHKIGEFGRIA